MTALRSVWVVCDEEFEGKPCDSQYPVDMHCETLQQAEREARQIEGWRTLRGGRHRCPNHCPTCGATGPTQLCTTASGRDHAARRRQMVAS